MSGMLNPESSRYAGMAVALQFLETKEQAGIQAFWTVVAETEVEGDLVGGLKAYAIDLAGHSIGFVFQDCLGLIPLLFD